MNLIVIVATMIGGVPPQAPELPQAPPVKVKIVKQSCTCGHGCQCAGTEGGVCDCASIARVVVRAGGGESTVSSYDPATVVAPARIIGGALFQKPSPPAPQPRIVTYAPAYYDPSPVPSYYRPLVPATSNGRLPTARQPVRQAPTAIRPATVTRRIAAPVCVGGG